MSRERLRLFSNCFMLASFCALSFIILLLVLLSFPNHLSVTLCIAFESRSGSDKMDKLERIMSRPVAKPYRSKGVKDNESPHLNDKGLLDFSPNDIESKICSKLAHDFCR